MEKIPLNCNENIQLLHFNKGRDSTFDKALVLVCGWKYHITLSRWSESSLEASYVSSKSYDSVREGSLYCGNFRYCL